MQPFLDPMNDTALYRICACRVPWGAENALQQVYHVSGTMTYKRYGLALKALDRLHDRAKRRYGSMDGIRPCRVMRYDPETETYSDTIG